MNRSVLSKVFAAIFALLVLGCVGWLAAPPVGYNENYAPDQPIPYSHAVHAGKYQIPCQYCHSTAENSRHASVPALNVCMNCHHIVATQSPLIQRLQQAYENGESIPWTKVHMLPDFVHFNHKRHVQANVACQECHGKIQEMVTVKQVKDLSMGWCIDCHRKPENNAPTSCSTCHY